MEYVKCNLCGEDKTTLLFVGKDRVHNIDGEFNVVKCEVCGLVYINPRPNEAEIAAYYPEDYSPYQGEKKNNIFIGHAKKFIIRREIDKLRKILPPRASILEVGCSYGELLASLRDIGGFRVKGVDISLKAASIARDRYRLDVIAGTLFDGKFPNESFNLVIMKHVLEHMHDPRAVVCEARRILKKDGKLFLWIPNIDSIIFKLFKTRSYGYEIPRHLYHFTTAALRILLEKNGMKISRVEHDPVPNDWVYNAKFLIDGSGRLDFIQKYLAISNPIFMGLFCPISFACAMLHQSGRVKVLAERDNA